MKKDKKAYHSIKKPNFLGGKKAFQEFLAKNLVYPKDALENKIEGIAHIKCETSDRGKVLKAESINKLGYGLDEEAERLCLLMRFDNTEERGLKIKHTHTIRVPFILPKEPKEPLVTVNYNYQTVPAEKKKDEEKKGGSYNYTVKL